MPWTLRIDDEDTVGTDALRERARDRLVGHERIDAVQCAGEVVLETAAVPWGANAFEAELVRRPDGGYYLFFTGDLLDDDARSAYSSGYATAAYPLAWR